MWTQLPSYKQAEKTENGMEEKTRAGWEGEKGKDFNKNRQTQRGKASLWSLFCSL